MPKVVRLLDKSQSHSGHCPLWPSMSPAETVNKKVFAQGTDSGKHLILVKGDSYKGHSCGHDQHKHPHVNPKAQGASSKVKIGNIGVHRDGDGISCGDAADNGATRVFCDGGGTPGLPLGPGETVGYVVGSVIVTAAPGINFPYSYTIDVFTQHRIFVPGSGGAEKKYRFTAITPIYEEGTKKMWKNYSSSHPLVKSNKVKAGADLPEHAPDTWRAPIEVLSKTYPTSPPNKVPPSTLGPGLRWWTDAQGNILGVRGALTGLPPHTYSSSVPPKQNFLGPSNFIVTIKPLLGQDPPKGSTGLEGTGTIIVSYPGTRVT